MVRRDVEDAARLNLNPKERTDQMARKYELTEIEAQLVFKLVEDHCAAYKNWIVTAVESGKLEYARELVRGLREYQELTPKLNVAAHRWIDGRAGFGVKPKLQFVDKTDAA